MEKLIRNRINESNQDFFNELFLLDLNGVILISSDITQEGKTKFEYDYFINGKKNIFIKNPYLSETNGKESFTISSPVIDISNKVVGVIVARISMSYLNKITFDKTGLGETGEIYLINKDGYMITSSRFLEDTFLNQKVNTENANACLADLKKLKEDKLVPNNSHVHKDNMSIGFFNDYRGVYVLGAYYPSNEISWCLLAEIDESEVMLKIRESKSNIRLLIVGFICFIIIVAIIYSTYVSKQIKKLTMDINKITKGKFDIQLKKSSISEIQSLNDSLNRILASLKLAVLRSGKNEEYFGIGDLAKQKENIEEMYKKLYESSSDAIMLLEPPSWKFTAANPATIKLFKAKNEKEFISKSPELVSPKKQSNGKLSSEVAKKMIEKAMLDGQVSFKWIHKSLDGKNFKVNVLLTRFELNGKKVLQATVRKIGNNE